MKDPLLPPVNPLSGFRPSGAPPELQARVLAASRAALLREPFRRDPWTALWESRPLRLAWAACVTLLLLGNALLETPVRPHRAAPPPSVARQAPDRDADLLAVSRLPRLDLSARPLGAGPGRPPEPAAPSGPRRPEEDRT